MSRICLPSNDNCLLQFFSISEEVRGMMNNIIDFSVNLAPGYWLLMLFVFAFMIMMIIFMNLRKGIKQVGK